MAAPLDWTGSHDGSPVLKALDATLSAEDSMTLLSAYSHPTDLVNP
jgi:hypothetical protein